MDWPRSGSISDGAELIDEGEYCATDITSLSEWITRIMIWDLNYGEGILEKRKSADPSRFLKFFWLVYNFQ